MQGTLLLYEVSRDTTRHLQGRTQCGTSLHRGGKLPYFIILCAAWPCQGRGQPVSPCPSVSAGEGDQAAPLRELSELAVRFFHVHLCTWTRWAPFTLLKKATIICQRSLIGLQIG
jgi:hypothetical protein